MRSSDIQRTWQKYQSIGLTEHSASASWIINRVTSLNRVFFVMALKNKLSRAVSTQTWDRERTNEFSDGVMHSLKAVRTRHVAHVVVSRDL